MRTAAATKTTTKSSRHSSGKSAPKERHGGSQKSATPGQSSTTDVHTALQDEKGTYHLR